MIGGALARPAWLVLATAAASTGLAPAALAARAAAPAFEQQLPANDGWVTDLAGLLTASDEQQLEATMDSFRRGSGHDIALLTVPDLQGEPIEDYARRVAREWKLGSKETSDGALLVVSTGDRALRIEVGRGLEGTLTDAVCGRIIRDVITPRFQAGDFADGLRSGVEALQQAAGGDYAALPEPRAVRSSDGWVAIPLVIFVVILIVILMRRRGGPRGRRRAHSRHGIWPWLVLADSLGRSSGGGGFSGGGFGGGGFGGGFGGHSGGGFGGFGGGGGFSGGGASGRW